MKRLVLLLLLGALALLTACSAPPLSGNTPAAEAAPPTAGAVHLSTQTGETYPRTISVNGSGVASAAPDVAYITLGVETINPDPAIVVDESTKKMETVLAALKDLGIAEADMQTVTYNLWIEQVHDREGMPTGETRYHLVHQMRIKVTDLAKTGQVLQAALKAGANTVAGVEFTIADPTPLQQQAREKAMASARAKAEQLAAGFGVKLGAVRSINEFSGPLTPVPVALSEGMGGGGVPVQGGTFNVTIEVQVTFDIAD
jgi:uncharacterized protein YggE